MAYSNNPNLPKARAFALKLLLVERIPLNTVANRCGVHRSTIYRWKTKWLELNKDVQLQNYNKPRRKLGRVFRFAALRWTIPTLNSRPCTNPHQIANSIVERILELRRMLKRCAEVIWYHITKIDQIRVSLSSVRRILKRNHCFDGARKNRVRSDNPRRPFPTEPGELVQTDTIHYVCPLTKRRRYVYTVIDLYSRMTYAEVHSRILPGIAADIIGRAQGSLGFRFSMVQADNGPEFGRYFAQCLMSVGTTVRHSRLGRPNDNAHIERFNRTIQEECLGHYLTSKTTNTQIQTKIDKYIEYYNKERIHLGLQLKTPIQMLQRS
jgi:transposase InsO family protein